MSTPKTLNPHQQPHLVKAVVNVGVGSVLEKDQRTKIADVLTAITGQKTVATKARKSVAAFKIRAGNTVGYMATLRGKRLENLKDRLINIVLPRTRDFRGIKQSAVTDGGCLNLGIKDASIFPEIRPETLTQPVSLEITFVSTAASKAEADTYFRTLGFPIEK